jgi:hypothetical protein
MSKPMCRCGCGQPAAMIVQTPDYDPAYPNGKPAPDEPVCLDAYEYLRDSAAELGLPFRRVRSLP